MILSLVDKVIKIDRGGPESRVGKLLAAADDHVTLFTEDEGVIYYKTHHIKSLTNNTKKGLQFNIDIPEDFEYKSAKDFKGVLESLKYHWVKINRGGPETLEGVLDAINDDFITIVLNEEVIRLSMFHIRNISYGAKVEKPKTEEKENNDKENKKEENNKQKNDEKESK